MNAFLIPGGAGTRPETCNTRLHEFVRSMLADRDNREIAERPSR